MIYEANTSIFNPLNRLIPIYKTWKYFNSYEVPDIPTKEWTKWSEIQEKPKKKLFDFNKIKELFKKETEEEREEEIQKYAEMSKEELFEEMNRSEENE